MGLLATSLVSYGWSRRFILNREISQEIKSGRGVAAGSPYGPYELAVYLDGLIHIVRGWNKVHNAKGMHATQSIHVDDISVCISGKNGPALARASGELARKLAFHVEGLHEARSWQQGFLDGIHGSTLCGMLKGHVRVRWHNGTGGPEAWGRLCSCGQRQEKQEGVHGQTGQW